MLRSGKLLARVNDERLRAILTTHRVTELLEETFGVPVKPSLLYQGEPQMYPREVSQYLGAKEILQRDIRIEVPCNETNTVTAILLARSWIAMDELDREFGELLRAGEMTIGQIIRKKRFAVEYQNLSYRKVRSARLAAAFGTEWSQGFIRRSRMICHEKRPIIIVHEFVPL